MNVVEYRVERIPVRRDEPRLLGLVERLAELGRHGWHVASIDLTLRPAYEEGPITVLLERELDGPPTSPETLQPAASEPSTLS